MGALDCSNIAIKTKINESKLLNWKYKNCRLACIASSKICGK